MRISSEFLVKNVGDFLAVKLVKKKRFWQKSSTLHPGMKKYGDIFSAQSGIPGSKNMHFHFFYAATRILFEDISRRIYFIRFLALGTGKILEF